MATRRMISKSISTSKKLAKLDDASALIFTWLQAHTDDYGCMDGDAATVKAKVVPMRDYSNEQVAMCLKRMQEVGLIELYKVEDEDLLRVIAFEKHQTFRSDRPRRSEYPKPPSIATDTIDIPMTPKRQPKGGKRQRKLSEVKLSEVKLSEDKESYGDMGNVKLKIEEYRKLVDLMGDHATNMLIFELDTYIGSKGARYKSHYATILNWARRKSVEMSSKNKGKQIISST